jgi:hypothetical protein
METRIINVGTVRLPDTGDGTIELELDLERLSKSITINENGRLVAKFTIENRNRKSGVKVLQVTGTAPGVKHKNNNSTIENLYFKI